MRVRILGTTLRALHHKDLSLARMHSDWDLRRSLAALVLDVVLQLRELKQLEESVPIMRLVMVEHVAILTLGV